MKKEKRMTEEGKDLIAMKPVLSEGDLVGVGGEDPRLFWKQKIYMNMNK